MVALELWTLARALLCRFIEAEVFRLRPRIKLTLLYDVRTGCRALLPDKNWMDVSDLFTRNSIWSTKDWEKVKSNQHRAQILPKS